MWVLNMFECDPLGAKKVTSWPFFAIISAISKATFNGVKKRFFLLKGKEAPFETTAIFSFLCFMLLYYVNICLFVAIYHFFKAKIFLNVQTAIFGVNHGNIIESRLQACHSLLHIRDKTGFIVYYDFRNGPLFKTYYGRPARLRFGYNQSESFLEPGRHQKNLRLLHQTGNFLLA